MRSSAASHAAQSRRTQGNHRRTAAAPGELDQQHKLSSRASTGGWFAPAGLPSISMSKKTYRMGVQWRRDC
jgi:hypothetical protein